MANWPLGAGTHTPARRLGAALLGSIHAATLSRKTSLQGGLTSKAGRALASRLCSGQVGLPRVDGECGREGNQELPTAGQGGPGRRQSKPGGSEMIGCEFSLPTNPVPAALPAGGWRGV